MPTENADSSHRVRRESGRSRSRSPYRSSAPYFAHKRKRSASPKKVTLPFGAKRLHKHDFQDSRALFALYLDMQKQMYIEDLDEREIKGRWKSFLGKWYVKLPFL
jgi:hypothetical protein